MFKKPFRRKQTVRRQAAPTKNRLEIVSEMMEIVLSAKAPQCTKMAVLDVSKGKLYTQTVTIPQLAVLLEGEAAAFLRIWESV